MILYKFMKMNFFIDNNYYPDEKLKYINIMCKCYYQLLLFNGQKNISLL